MARPGFVLDVDERTPPLVVPDGDGFRTERFPLGTRVVYPNDPIDRVPDQIAEIVNDTVKRGGVLMVPAFALGRTQTMVQQIHELRDAKRIPGWLPVYIDSPLATRLTVVHRQFDELLDEESRRMLEPFDFPNLTYVASPDESRSLNRRWPAWSRST